MEILTSRSLAQDAIRDLKLYTTYASKGRVKDQNIYGNQPLIVDIDAAHLEKLNRPINLSIKRNGAAYNISGTYSVPVDENTAEGPFSINKSFTLYQRG